MHTERVINRIEITEDGFIQVRHAEYLVEDTGRRTKLRFHRVAYPPGASLDLAEQAVKDYAAIAWTPAVVSAHASRVQAKAAKKG